MSKKVLCLGNALVDIITQLKSDKDLEYLSAVSAVSVGLAMRKFN